MMPWKLLLFFLEAASLLIQIDSTHSHFLQEVSTSHHQPQKLPQQQQQERDHDRDIHGMHYRQRSLAMGDFAEFNELVENAMIEFPDAGLTQNFMSLDITQLRCTSFQLDDLIISSRKTSLQTVLIDVEIVGLDMDCSARYDYDGWLFNGRGDVTVASYNNRAFVSASITSSNLNEVAPTTLRVESCNPTISINDLSFDGGILGIVLDRAESLFRNIFENVAERQLCQEFEVILEETVGREWLKFISETLDDYDPDTQAYVDPLQSEVDLANRTPTSIPLLNLQDKQTNFGQWTQMALDQAVTYLNQPVLVDVDDVTDDLRQDLRINALLREWILEEGTRALVLDKSVMSFMDGDNDNQSDNIIYQGQNELLDTTIRLDKLQLRGLDTLKTFEPLVDIGQYTLENRWVWDYLSFDIDLTFDVQASTSPDSIINAPPGQSPVAVVEQVRVHFGIRQLEALASVLLAINQNLLESVRVGSLLQTSQLLPCLLATIYKMEFSTLSVSAGTIETPSMEGLVSRGIDRVVSEALDAAFLLYEPIALDASPAFFQQSVRELLNANLVDKYIDVAETCTVEDQDFGSALVDFRDLLLEPQEALALGATGTSPYGDVVSTLVMSGLKEQVLNNQERINEDLIRPFTKEQSGREGMVSFPSSVLFGFLQGPDSEQGVVVNASSSLIRTRSSMSSSPSAASLWDRFQVQLSNIRIENIDTVAAPLSLLDPVESNVLSNRIQFDSSGFMSLGQEQRRDLKATIRLLLAIDGDSSPFKMFNELDVSISIPSVSVSFDMLANLQEQALMDFPLNDVSNANCWLAAIASGIGGDSMPSVEDSNSQVNVMGLKTRKSIAGGIFSKATSNLALKNFMLSISSFSMDAACISCSSPGANFISEVFDTLEEAGMSNVFTTRVEQLLEETMWDYWGVFEIDQILDDAQRFCPYSPKYEPHATAIDYEWPSLPNMSVTGVETAVALGLISMYSSLVVISKNHILLEPASSHKHDEEERLRNIFAINSLQPPIGSKTDLTLLDFTDLSKAFGSLGPVAFEEFRRYLNGVLDTSSRRLDGQEVLRVNEFLRTYLLNDEGAFAINLDDIGVQGSGFNISLTRCRIYGLDTVANIDALHVAGPFKLANELLVDRIELALDVNITMMGEQPRQMTLSYTLQDVYVQADIFLALNLNTLGDIELGSVLDMANILNCAMGGVHKLEISKLQVMSGIIETPKVDRYFSTEMKDSLSVLMESLFDKYRSDLDIALPIIFDTTVRDVANSLLPDLIRSLADKCEPPVLDESRQGNVDFRDLFLSETASSILGGRGNSPYGDLFRTIYRVINEEFLIDSQSINALLGRWTRTMSNVTGTFLMPGTTVDAKSSLGIAGLQAEMGFELSDISIQNVNSVGEPLGFATPVKGEANILSNMVSIGVGSEPLQLAARVILSLNDGDEMRIRNDLNVSINLNTISVLANILLKVAEPAFLSFPLRDLSDLNCWLATILSSHSDSNRNFRGIALLDHTIAISNLTVDMSCISCSSPKFDDLLVSLYSIKDMEEATSILREKSNELYDGDFVQVLLDQVVLDAAKQCRHRQEYDPNAIPAEFLKAPGKSLGFEEKAARNNESIYFNIANCVFAGCLLVMGVLGRRMLHRRNRKWIDSLSSEGAYLLSKQQTREREREQALNKMTTSLFHSQYIPKKVRVAVPFAILLNTILYLAGHLGVLSTVNIDASLAGEAFTIHNFLEFSFIKSTTSTYRNGGSEMAILIWIFTGIWPYIKLILSTLAWMLPPDKLSVSRRGRLLLWIDTLAKLSVVDVFTMMLGVAVLLVYFGGPDKSLAKDDALYTMKAIVTPGAGCYCLLIAQRLARVSSRYFLDYHQQVIELAIAEHEAKLCFQEDETCSTQESNEARNITDDDKASPSTTNGIEDEHAGTGKQEATEEGTAPPVDDGSHSPTTENPSQPLLNLDMEEFQPMNEESNNEACEELFAHLSGATSDEFRIDDDRELVVCLDKQNDMSTQKDAKEEALLLPLMSLENGHCIPMPEESKDEECSSGVMQNQEGGDNSVIVDPWSEFQPQEAGFEDEEDQDSSESPSLKSRSYQWGSIGVYFTGVAVLVIFIIACIFTPSVSLDTSEVFQLSLESDHTFAEAAPEYGVFTVISFVLLKARFVLDTTMDYVGFGFLLLVGFIAIGMTFFIQTYQFFRRRMEQRRRGLAPARICYWPYGASLKMEEYNLPSYLRMYKWKHIEIYLISITIGVWQLGSIASYAIHLYCDILGRSFEVMAYVGLVEESSGVQCFGIQAKLADNLLIIGASFFILMASFLVEVTAQIRKNVKDAKSLIQHEDSERLSLAWHPEKHDGSMRKKNRLSTSVLDLTMSMDQSWDGDDDEPGRAVAPVEGDEAFSEGNRNLIPRPTYMTSVDRSSTATSRSSTVTSTSTYSSSAGAGVHAFDEFGSFL